MHGASGQGLDAGLQLAERERGVHQLEHHRAVGDLRPQPRDGGRDDPPVVELHPLAGHQLGVPAPGVRRLGQQAGLVEQLVALEGEVRLPGLSLKAEQGRRPRRPRLADRTIGVRDPGADPRKDDVQRGPGRAQVLVGEQVVPAAPDAAARAVAGPGGQAEIADRDAAGVGVAVGVGERVQLLEEAELASGLLLGPVADGGLQRPVTGAQRSGRQPARVVHLEHARLAPDHGDDDRDHLGGHVFSWHYRAVCSTGSDASVASANSPTPRSGGTSSEVCTNTSPR